MVVVKHESGGSMLHHLHPVSIANSVWVPYMVPQYSTCGHAKVLYAISLVSAGVSFRFLQRKPHGPVCLVDTIVYVFLPVQVCCHGDSQILCCFGVVEGVNVEVVCGLEGLRLPGKAIPN